MRRTLLLAGAVAGLSLFPAGGSQASEFTFTFANKLEDATVRARVVHWDFSQDGGIGPNSHTVIDKSFSLAEGEHTIQASIWDAPGDLARCSYSLTVKYKPGPLGWLSSKGDYQCSVLPTSTTGYHCDYSSTPRSASDGCDFSFSITRR